MAAKKLIVCAKCGTLYSLADTQACTTCYTPGRK